MVSARLRLTPEDLKSHLCGAIAFPITPYAAQGDVDLDAVRANAAWLAESGVCSIVAPSGTGEFFSLDPGEAAAVTRATVEAVNGRVPVIAGVGIGPRVAADLARAAEAAGADGVLILPPYYALPDPAGLIDYYQATARATKLAVMPYARDSAVFTPEAVEQLACRIPNLIAFKDGRGDLRLFMRILERVNNNVGEHRLVWLGGVGDDLLAPYVAAGAQGFTSSLACFWPEISVALWQAAAKRDWDSLAKLHARVVQPIYELRSRRRSYEVSVMKAAMEILGHRAGPPRPPLVDLLESDREDLCALLDKLKVPTARDRAAR